MAAAAADGTVVSCTHHRWTKDGGGAFEVAPVNDNVDAVVIWQIEEWTLGANLATKLPVDPSEAAPHKTAVSHKNPTPIKLKKALERTEGAGIKITDWRRSHRPGLPWFAAAEAGVASTPAGPSSTVVMSPGRYGSLDAFIAHTEAAKMESTAMTTKQSGQISKLEETMQKSAGMMQQLIQMTGANEQKTKALTEQVNKMGAKTDMIIEVLKVAGVAFPQPSGSSATQLTQSGVGATPAAAPAAAGAPASARLHRRRTHG